MKKILLLMMLVFGWAASAQTINLGPTGSQVSGILQPVNGGLGVNAASINQNKVFAGPAAGGSGLAQFRTLVSGDIPQILIVQQLTVTNLNTTGLVVSNGAGLLGAVQVTGFVFASSSSPVVAAATATNFNNFFTTNVTGCSTAYSWYSPEQGECLQQFWPSAAGIPYYTGTLSSGTGWGSSFNAGNTIPTNYLPSTVGYTNSVQSWTAAQTFSGNITTTNFTGLLYGNGVSPVSVASGSQIVSAIGSSAVEYAGALSGSPSTCSAGQYSVGISSNGNAICSSTVQITVSSTTMGVSSISANTCLSPSGSYGPISESGVTASSTFTTAFASDPSSVTGWGTSGGLYLALWPSSGYINWKLCNQSFSTITLGTSSSNSITINVGVH